MSFYNRYVENGAVSGNTFLTMQPEKAEPPVFADIKNLLPQPFWTGRDDVVACYWKAWELAFRSIGRPTVENGFVSNYLRTCFNDCLFMWDSVIALMYGKYGRRAFNFQKTLDNLYAKQHPDGFICREIAEEDGTDRFHRYDPSSTGPNTMPWSEWEYFLTVSDTERLGRVFPVLAAYHQWLKAWRTWPDGAYWSSGWGTGMDNQPRLRPGSHMEFYHGHMSWADSCFQMIFSARTLTEIAEILGRGDEAAAFGEEAESLARFVNEKLWDAKENCYFDRYEDGSLSGIKTLGVYWALLAGAVPPERLPAFVAHLEDKKSYNRPHRVPSMPADSPFYSPEGNYWRGGVWVFTNYMLMRGLTRTGYDALAYDIAVNHLDNVVKVFGQTGTIWENYSPEYPAPGKPALRDFVGAGGVSPISVLFEYVFGLRPEAQKSRLVWDVRRLEAHGVNNYPFGINGVMDLSCGERLSEAEEPKVTIRSNIPAEAEVRWNNGASVKRIHIQGGTK
ncbi:MAG: glycoside hydrolase [Firmicutes bacterium]|nr:glycoside hydrolase [Bacillota bacterium]